MVNRCDWQLFFAWRRVRLIDGEMRRGWVERRPVSSRDGVVGYGVTWHWEYRPAQVVRRWNLKPLIPYVIVVVALFAAAYIWSGGWLGW